MTKISTFLAALALTVAAGCSKKTKQEDTTPPAQTASQDFSDPTPQVDERPADPPPPRGADLGEIIYFEFDSSSLDDSARHTLEENAKWMREDDARTITIEGHTDEVGTAEYNLGLGERRARSAKDYLVRLGIEDKRISIITYGKEKPVSDEDRLNRRSVFIATRR
jgi:peptidoglycan-associated lipoprotein